MFTPTYCQRPRWKDGQLDQQRSQKAYFRLVWVMKASNMACKVKRKQKWWITVSLHFQKLTRHACGQQGKATETQVCMSSLEPEAIKQATSSKHITCTVYCTRQLTAAVWDTQAFRADSSSGRPQDGNSKRAKRYHCCAEARSGVVAGSTRRKDKEYSVTDSSSPLPSLYPSACIR